jgi:asparagine synthase (glutamine-hydrolysing)
MPHEHGRLILAPEYKAILADPEMRAVPDRTALAEYVRLQFLMGDKTFFQGIKILPGATILRYEASEDRLQLRPSWQLEPEPEGKATFDDVVEEAGRLLQRAVREGAGGPGRLGMYLSGGLDARVMLGMLEPEQRDGLPTLTYGPADCRDVAYAAQIARRMHTAHHWLPMDDGRWVPEFAETHLALTEGFHSWIHGHGISILPQPGR